MDTAGKYISLTIRRIALVSFVTFSVHIGRAKHLHVSCSTRIKRFGIKLVTTQENERS